MENTIDHSDLKIQELLIRLERCNHIVPRLNKRLNSYTCEPKNPNHFEKLYGLKQDFRAFAREQNRIMELAKQKGEVNFSKHDIQLHLDRFKELQREIAAYLLTMEQT
ncbi:hypothetical protein [Flagellimonas nanhaiensis]|uniref:Uncharacterized protein n=1 Tax=Flagellimonas nanhaiensis TaxID=2292706 RepID=A0A371JUP8_9FLAO|nr:hypothetical protein [Allomuricauda nanhaiensis]RDY61506.1 hypothetical protein DX873_04925 [Allomuricauda nanhaiensis]